jgi:hypothetical protein
VPALSGITLLPGRSGLLNHLPLDSSLWLPSEVHFILAGAWPELSYSDSRSSTRAWPAKREAFVQHDKERIQESVLKRHKRSHRKPTALQASARSSFKLYQVLFYDSKYSQPCHMYSPIARRWQEITRLLPLKAGLSIYSSLSYIGIMVIISGQGLDINAANDLIQHL